MRKWGLVSVLVFVLSLVFVSIALSQQKEVEIDGLVIDQTQTRIGQEFYQNFVSFWEKPLGIGDYNIVIIEMANPTWGSWVWIEVGGFVSKETVYREILKPKPEEIEEAVNKGIESVKEYLYRLNEHGKEEREKDTAGSGIY
ncbi:MAG: CsgE family curli-type amyloid fiber assembly protein [Patescibacteria group bacterium]